MAILKETPSAIKGRSNLMAATEYISTLAVELGQYVRLVIDDLRQKTKLKADIDKLDAKIAEHSNLRHAVTKRSLAFWRWTNRHKADLLTGTSKTVKTGAGSFAWKLNSAFSLVFESEQAVIAEIRKLGLADKLLITSLNKEAIKSAVLSGQIKDPKSFSVEQLERLVVMPTDLPPITIYEDGRIEFDCEIGK